MRAPRRIAAPALALALLAGCGNERFQPRALELGPSPASSTYRYPAAGVTVDLPRGFGVRRSARPGVFRATLGESFIAAYAYRRAEQLPRNEEELRIARRRLERTIKTRSKAYKLRSARPTRVAGARAVEIVGEQTLSQRRLRIRSLHVFKGSAEYVIELASPVGIFPRMDRAVTPTIKRSLELTGKPRRPAARRKPRR